VLYSQLSPSPSPVNETMAPTPIINPLQPIQDNWDTIKPWTSAYNKVLGALGTLFGFATAVALIVDHDWQLPKWPFTEERWHPKPTIEKEAGDEEEVSEDQLVDDVLAEVAGGVKKRGLVEDEEELFEEFLEGYLEGLEQDEEAQ